jgi:hypothetical protein
MTTPHPPRAATAAAGTATGVRRRETGAGARRSQRGGTSELTGHPPVGMVLHLLGGVGSPMLLHVSFRTQTSPPPWCCMSLGGSDPLMCCRSSDVPPPWERRAPSSAHRTHVMSRCPATSHMAKAQGFGFGVFGNYLAMDDGMRTRARTPGGRSPPARPRRERTEASHDK